MLIGNKKIEAGIYTIFTKSNPNGWDVFFHTEHNMYGVPETMLNENIKATIHVPSKIQERMVETFSIGFENIRNNAAIWFYHGIMYKLKFQLMFLYQQWLPVLTKR